MEKRRPLKSCRDLDVYQNLYKAMLLVMREIAPKLPREEKYDLKSQMMRACKAPLALLAEGWAKRYQKKYWHKYLIDAIGECDEMITHLQICTDIYSVYVDAEKCNDAIKLYDHSSRQLHNLKERWRNFHED